MSMDARTEAELNTSNIVRAAAETAVAVIMPEENSARGDALVSVLELATESIGAGIRENMDEASIVDDKLV